MLPLPAPLALDVSAIQLGSALRLQLHELAAVTVQLPLAAPAAKLLVRGVRLQDAQAPAAWLTLNVEATPGPVTEPEPERAVLLLAATEYVKLPLPVPLVPAGIVTQLGTLPILHGQLAGALTLIVPLFAADVSDRELGVRVGAVGHKGGASWLIVNVVL